MCDQQDSDRPAHLSSLIRAFTDSMNLSIRAIQRGIDENQCHTGWMYWLNLRPLVTQVLTLWRLETPKRVTGKQCRSRSDAAECAASEQGRPSLQIVNHFSLVISTSYSLIYIK